MLKLIWLICIITVFLNWSSTKARQVRHTTKHLSYTDPENVTSCIDACTPQNSETVRNKRQSEGANTIAQAFVTAWQESIKAFRKGINTFCEGLDEDATNIECFQKCQEIYQNMRLQKIIDIYSYYIELGNKTCTNQDETKLKCLNDAKKIFGPILLGKACKEEVDDFMAFGVDEITISDEELTMLFDCPAETAKKSANDDCKDFVYQVIKKFGELAMNIDLMEFEEGIEEGKKKAMQKENDRDGQNAERPNESSCSKCYALRNLVDKDFLNTCCLPDNEEFNQCMDRCVIMIRARNAGKWGNKNTQKECLDCITKCEVDSAISNIDCTMTFEEGGH